MALRLRHGWKTALTDRSSALPWLASFAKICINYLHYESRNRDVPLKTRQRFHFGLRDAGSKHVLYYERAVRYGPCVISLRESETHVAPLGLRRSRGA